MVPLREARLQPGDDPAQVSGVLPAVPAVGQLGVPGCLLMTSSEGRQQHPALNNNTQHLTAQNPALDDNTRPNPPHPAVCLETRISILVSRQHPALEVKVEVAVHTLADTL